MAEPAQGAESAVELGGYQPELKRTLGSFQMFAISFAFISVAVGIFATYDQVLQTGGPLAIWLWILAAIGQVLVALVYAQFAARIPLSGSAYQWGSRLANPKVGFGLGWLTVCYLAIGVVATRLSGCRPEVRLFRDRRRPDGRDDPGPCYACRLRLRGEPGRRG
jgi:amino acid permease